MLLAVGLASDVGNLAHVIAGFSQHQLNKLLLHISHLEERTEVYRTVLAAGANIDYQDEDGRTALFICVKHGHYDVAEFFIGKGNCHISNMIKN